MPHRLYSTLQIRAGSMDIKTPKKCEPLLKAFCRVTKFNSRSLTPKNIRCNDQITIRSVLVRHRSYMLVDTKYFLHKQ